MAQFHIFRECNDCGSFLSCPPLVRNIFCETALVIIKDDSSWVARHASEIINRLPFKKLSQEIEIL